MSQFRRDARDTFLTVMSTHSELETHIQCVPNVRMLPQTSKIGEACVDSHMPDTRCSTACYIDVNIPQDGACVGEELDFDIVCEPPCLSGVVADPLLNASLRIPAGGRIFYVIARGLETFNVPLTYLGAGRYRGALVPRIPNQTLTVVAHQRFHNYSYDQPCGSVVPIDGGRRWDPIRVGTLIDGPVELNISVTAAPARDAPAAPTRACEPAELADGRWESCRAPSGAVVECETGATHSTWRDSLSWVPRTCTYGHYVRADALATLQQAGVRNIVLAGDSQTRTLFAALYDFLLRDPSRDKRHTSPDFTKKFHGAARACTEGADAIDLCIYFAFSGHSWNKATLENGMNVTLEGSVVDLTRNELATSGRTIMAGADTALLVNTGQWLGAFACSNQSAPVYADAASWLARVRTERGVRAYFATTHSTAKFLRHIFAWKDYRLTPSIADRLDRETRSAMQSAKVPILDWRALTRARLDTVCDVGGHFACSADSHGLGGNTGKFFAGLEGVGALKGPVVFTEAQMLIHAITAPSFSIENTS